VTEVIWTLRAESDLDLIAEYIAKDNPEAAARIVRVVCENAALLVDFPNRGRQGRVENTRELPTGTRYMISYRISGDAVWIVSIFDSARDDPKDAFH
jgi:toxin ParE1/3/4